MSCYHAEQTNEYITIFIDTTSALLYTALSQARLYQIYVPHSKHTSSPIQSPVGRSV